MKETASNFSSTTFKTIYIIGSETMQDDCLEE